MHPTELAKKRTQTLGVTGWGLQPRRQDINPLVILDVDIYGESLEEVTKKLFLLDGGKIPEGVGVVRSCSGGFHFYFRHPRKFHRDEPPTKFDFASGVRGDVRSSIRGGGLLVLPGSVATNKNTKTLSRYEAISGPLERLSSLAEVPEYLWNMLTASVRDKKADAQAGKEPTEVRDLRSLVSRIPTNSEKRGTWSGLCYNIGRIYGRIWAADKPRKETKELLWESLGPIFCEDSEGGGDYSEFEKHFTKGYSDGRKNSDKYAPAKGIPSESEVLAEFRAVFGSLPWLQENIDINGKRSCYILGLGDSPEKERLARRKKIQGIENRAEVLGLLAQLSPVCDMDALTKSPLFISSGWFNVLKIYLHRRLDSNCVSAEPELELQEKLKVSARDAGDAGFFGRTLREGQPMLDSGPDPYRMWLWATGGEYILVATPQSIKQVLMHLPPECQSYLKDYGHKKRCASGYTWRFPLKSLEDTSLIAVVESRYEEFITERLSHGGN